MSVVANVTVPAEETAFGALLEVEPDATVTVETTVPTTGTVVPYLWVPGDVAERMVDALRGTSAVESATIVDDVDRFTLVRVTWTDDVNGFVRSIRDSEAIVTSASGSDDAWTFRLRFPSYEDVSVFYSTCEERDLSVELTRLRDAGDGTVDSEFRFGLTPAQREIVLTAYEEGYFEVPRETTLVELGERFDVTDSAVSQRLRRGLATLVGATLDRERGADPESPG